MSFIKESNCSVLWLTSPFFDFHVRARRHNHNGALVDWKTRVESGANRRVPTRIALDDMISIRKTVLRFALCIAGFIGGALAQTASDPVLVVHGICPQAADDCTVAVNRQQFEDWVNLASPGAQASPSVKDHMAKVYAELMALDNAAVERGIDTSEEYQNALRWFRDRTLADLLRKRLEKESSDVTAAEVTADYEKRRTQFDVVTLRRLVLPKTNFAVADRNQFDQDLQRVAGELRDRLARGEDIDLLQKEGYQTLGFSGLPPATRAGTRRRADLPSEVSEDVFSLRPGEVSKVENEFYSLVIYKVEAKRTLPEGEVAEEIERHLAKEKLERALTSITGNVWTEWSKQYFGAVSAK